MTIWTLTVRLLTVKPASPAADVCTALIRIGTHMATGFDQHFAELNITQAQFRLLLAAWTQGGHEGISPSELAEYLLIERPTVSVLSQGLVQRGWLQRRPGENRRSHRLALTAAGGRMLERVAPLALDLAADTLAGFTPTQLKALLKNLEHIEARLRTHRHKAIPKSTQKLPASR